MDQHIPLNLLPDPLDQYPILDLASLKALGTDNDTFRKKYGLDLYKQIGLRSELLYCAYCGCRFDDFSHWLRASLDHVVPKSAALELEVDKNIWDSVLNLVFCCRTCNDFNRGLKEASKALEILPYRPALGASAKEFLGLRRATFPRRLEHIADQRAKAQEIYLTLWIPKG